MLREVSDTRGITTKKRTKAILDDRLRELLHNRLAHKSNNNFSHLAHRFRDSF